MPLHYSIELSWLKNVSVTERIEEKRAIVKELVFDKDVYAKLEKPDKHEIKIGDHYYDVVSQSVKDGKVYCKVYADEEETGLRKILSRHHSDNKHSNRHKRISFWWPITGILTQSNFQLNNHFITILNYGDNAMKLLFDVFIDDNLIPPECFSS